MDWTAISAVVTAVATVVLAVLTWRYVKLTHEIVEAQTQPIVTLVLDRDENGVVSFVLRNDGGGAAFDVQVELPSEVRKHPFSSEQPLTDGPLQEMKDGPMVSGVPCLPPHSSVRQIWGYERTLWDAFKDASQLVAISFRRSPKGRVHETCHLLSMAALDPRRLSKYLALSHGRVCHNAS